MNIKHNFKEIFISCDIEATGPIPGDYSMSSIGAYVAGGRTSENEIIHFTENPESDTPVINYEDVFYAEMSPLPGSTFIKDAIKVGILEGMSPEAAEADLTGEAHWNHMIEHGQVPLYAMRDFVKFANDAQARYATTEGKAVPVFMAFPASFDWTWVYWYIRHFDLDSPFGFSGVLDLKTLFSVKKNIPINRSTKRNFPRSVFSKMPHTHRADDDAIEQGIMGINLMLLP